MPQLIAMIIVVVGAMIYMFQTFGGTGDKIEGIAQKSSIITELNNIKGGVKLAARDRILFNSGQAAAAGTARTLEGIAEAQYFAQQINEQLNVAGQTDTLNTYNAISFGGTRAFAGDMTIQLVNNVANRVPGLFVTLQGTLADNAGFIEAQLATDLGAIAHIDRNAIAANAPAGTLGVTGVNARIPADTAAVAGRETDGMFIIYFTDFGDAEVVR